MTCPNCGETIKSKKNQMNFCGFCGTNLKTGKKPWVSTQDKTENSAELLSTNPQPPVVSYQNTESSLPHASIQNHEPDVAVTHDTQKTTTSTTDTKPSSVVIPPSYDAVKKTTPTQFIQPPSQEDTAEKHTNSRSSAPDHSANAQDSSFAFSNNMKKISPNAFEHVINVPQKNIEIHSAVNDNPDTASESSITYMAYTKSSKELDQTDTTEQNTSETATPSAAASPVADKEINKEVIAEETAPAAEPEKPKTATIINFIGQNKSVAANTLKLKGIKVETVYVTDEQEYDTIISQSVPAETEIPQGTSITLTVSAGTWSEWSENSFAPSSALFITESHTLYRKRSRTRTVDKRETTNISEFDDYTLVNTTYKYSEWKNDQYYTSDILKINDTCALISKANGYKYAGWFESTNTLNISFSSPDVANFFNTNLTSANWQYDEIISDFNAKPDVRNWRLANDSMTKTPAGDSITSNIFLSTHTINGKSYAMRFGSPDTTWFIYKRRSILETIYHFEKEIISNWSDWSDWDEHPVSASEDIEVEEKTRIRSRRKNSKEL